MAPSAPEPIPFVFLSPRQHELFRFIEAHPELQWQSTIQSNNLIGDWELATDLARKQR